MRLGCINGRAVLIDGDTALDVATASAGRFGPGPTGVFDQWEEFAAWAADAPRTGGVVFTPGDLDCPSPTPRQVFGIGINYRSHADETGIAAPSIPAVFTKFPASLAGADTTVELPADTVDWEVELVVVIGRECKDVPEQDALAYRADTATPLGMNILMYAATH